jgi:transcriptional regulator with XRE-family HTH domain
MATMTTIESPGDLAQLLRARRIELGLTQERLADLAGFHRSSVILFERGTRSGSLAFVLELAHALGMDLELRPRDR